MACAVPPSHLVPAMSLALWSTLGLLLCLAPGLVHGVELISPLWSRWVVNLVLPFFGPGLPRRDSALSGAEQLRMLDAARAAGPTGKDTASEDYVFLMLFEQRQGGIAFVSVIAGVLYALTLPVDGRAPLHLLLAVMSALFALVNVNHAGIPLLGHHPRVSRHGKHVGMLFAPFWIVALVCNTMAFLGAA